MCWFVPLIIAGVSAVAQMKANEDSTAAEVDAANFNAAESARQAKISEMQAHDAFARGEAERDNYMRQAARERGSLTAAFGASGLDVNRGSSSDILADTAALAHLDGKTIRHSAAADAWGYKENARQARTQSQLSLMQGADAVKAGQRNQKSILLNTAGSMAGSLAYKPSGTPQKSGSSSPLAATKNINQRPVLD